MVSCEFFVLVGGVCFLFWIRRCFRFLESFLLCFWLLLRCCFCLRWYFLVSLMLIVSNGSSSRVSDVGGGGGGVAVVGWWCVEVRHEVRPDFCGANF